nr:succinate dehydrogenase assembly factor 4 [Aureimonas glaciei]
MTDQPTDRQATEETQTPLARVVSPAAERALAEAAERRRREAETERPPEQGGRAGPDPVRYGDWERNGIISDF